MVLNHIYSRKTAKGGKEYFWPHDVEHVQDAAGKVTVVFPNGTPAERIVQVQAKDFGSVVPIRVALTPDYGDRVIVDAELDNTAAGVATASIPVTFPINVTVAVNVWTR
jgi:hypothetical protein